MDVFLENIPFHLNAVQVKKKLAAHTAAVKCYAYYVTLFRAPNKGKGKITFPTVQMAERFLEFFGVKGRQQATTPITLLGRTLYCRRAREPVRDLFLVRGLVSQQLKAERQVRLEQFQSLEISGYKNSKQFNIVELQCGTWGRPTSTHQNTTFTPRYILHRPGILKLHHTDMRLNLSDSLGADSRYVISFLYSGVDKIFIEKLTGTRPGTGQNEKQGYVILALKRAPKIYRQSNNSKLITRVSALNEVHEQFVGISFVYRIRFQEQSDAARVLRLSTNGGVPFIERKDMSIYQPQIEFEQSFRNLLRELQSMETSQFPVAFQLNALFANGTLPPDSIVSLLEKIKQLAARYGVRDTVEILRVFGIRIRAEYELLYVPAPSELQSRLTTDTERFIRIKALSARRFQAGRETDLAWVHRATITPSGCYFSGPNQEATNRVLRKYPGFEDYFLRVTFAEEDSGLFKQERGVKNEEIYGKQFLNYLRVNPSGTLVIAGRAFSFVGFSNSSLRSSTCWFMAPFSFKGENIDAKKVVSDLGDFSRITCPGRYAARVGQAFSDTIKSIHIPISGSIEIPDIKRLDSRRIERNFTDGVGKIGHSLVQKIWKQSRTIGQRMPNVFQIRYAGAKGMIIVDPRIKTDSLLLRGSMVKFSGSEDRDLEIRDWAKRFDMYLNRPLVKLLEDLGVKDEVFFDLQSKAIRVLRTAGDTVPMAANFLKKWNVSSGALKLPWVIESMKNMEVDFREDSFLSRMLEVALLATLRAIKYKCRIPVPEGVTLFGVADDTGFLKDGEIYCTWERENRDEGPLQGRVCVTRSPALHPGDVQMVNAVADLPPDSPLRKLRNCVVFSTNGDRDLPSMLSGGDLDGDLYNIIYDPRFVVQSQPPAQYKRVTPVDLGRPVQAADVVTFFLDFMQNNLVGLISSLHLQLADQKSDGVFHPDCLMLAEMASTAVDFPKSGIQVNREQLRSIERSSARPDFMAPGPRALVRIDQVEVDSDTDDGYDTDDENEPQPRHVYYPSQKVLGKLYRNIDERAFFTEVHRDIRSGVGGPAHGSVVHSLWEVLEPETRAYEWAQYIEAAKNLRQYYEDGMIHLMTEFSEQPWKYKLEEVEVFVGMLVGEDSQERHRKDATARMVEAFDELATSITDLLKRSDRETTVGMCMACLFVSLPANAGISQYELESFPWVVAGVILTEVDGIIKEKKGGRKSARRF